MYERLEDCPNCKHTKFNNRLIIQDHSISMESFALSECDKCGLLFTNPRPSEVSIEKYYDSKKYVSHHDDSPGLINAIYKIARSFNLNFKYRIIKKYSAGKKLLDFGSGTGHFIHYFDKIGWESVGVEPNKNAQHRSMQLSDSQVFTALDDVPQDIKFDVITAWHVLEHVHQLKKTLRALKKRLSDDGYLFVALPNHLAYDAVIYGEFWAGYDVPRHLYHFTPFVFENVAASTQLQLVDQHPLKLDAFYVSMLSEKYKGSAFGLPKAILTGYNSNRLARKTGHYSSLIYVLKHA